MPAPPTGNPSNKNAPPASRELLGQILKKQGVAREGQIQEALAMQRERPGVPIGRCLIDLGFCKEHEITAALAAQAGLEMVALDARPAQETLALLDASTARTFRVLPLRVEGGELVVAIGDPTNLSVLDDLQFLVGKPIRAVFADPEKLKEIVESAYPAEATGLKAALAAAKGLQANADAKELAKSAPVVRLLNAVLQQAIRDQASDIHLEPFEDSFRVRYRVDGALFEIEAPPAYLAPALIARVKVMADLDIAETRVPQDGRIALSVEGKSVDLRVSTLPTMYGESCVMRVLDRTVVQLSLNKIGLREEERKGIQQLIDLPHGIVLVTGPTGSGKTTTLYAMLAAANDPSLKIITTEDPVEYDLEGIVQIPINDEIGVSFARVLRTILRQDPDIILVGEIRDRETATVAIEASLTGHLVFSTLHTNDAPSAITRLTDLGIDPFLTSATLEAIIAQRLVRRVCSNCKVDVFPDTDRLHELGLDADRLEGAKFVSGRGCDRCHFTGYKGRLAVFEMLTVNDTIRQLMLDHASTQRLREAARAQGMRPLRDSGLIAALDGMTTIDEVLRETMGVN
ncbi:MAG: Flp pilus assembly complex ATPase component TadA [Planctomycetes bacterium]|nr:Flp pilus assembly complex ATPase component TadA [Planctomycetota bacterium]